MGRYRDNPQAIHALVRPDEVHRALYLDPELFELEMRQLWRNTWIYVGHDSQVPKPGDFYTTQVAREPVIMIRGARRPGAGTAEPMRAQRDEARSAPSAVGARAV